MQYLWSPWRMEYIRFFNKGSECVFCEALTLSDSIDNLIVHRGKYAFVILNRFPYTSGHLMVLPYAHCSFLHELDTDIRKEIMELTNKAILVLSQIYKPEGYNIGMNIGEAAGAGIEEHLHMHVVPRWSGDTNYMTSLGATRVLPEALDETYRRIVADWGSTNKID